MHYVRDIYNRSTPVHTYPFSFEQATFSLRIRLPSTRIRRKRSMKTFRKRSPEWNLLKTLFSRVRVDRGKRNFSKTLSRVELFENAVFACTCGQTKRNFSKTLRTHYQFKSTPRNIRNLFKMADGRFSFLSFILWLISNLISCFQANLALLICQADYSRRRQNIIRLLPLPVSRGGRLDLPLVWLCFALILTF